MLVLARGVKRVTKKFAQRTYRNQISRRRRLHMASFFGLTPSYRLRYAEVNAKSANCSQKMPIFTGISQSAIACVGC
jgi:hypothetical protein